MFQIINGDYFTRHPQDFVLNRPLGFNHYVFLLIRSEARLCIDSREYTVSPGSYLFIRPNTPYSYSNPGGSYMDDWIHFECDESDLALLSDDFFHHPFPCNNPSILRTYIEQLLWEKNFAPENLRGENTHQLFSIIVRHAKEDLRAGCRETYSPYLFRLQKNRMTLQSTPYLNHRAKDMAAALGISLSYYEHLYSELFGKSFRSDLIEMRIEYAKGLIKETNMSFEQIAIAGGYSSEVHFYRQFYAKTGMTPGEFRDSQH